MTPLAVYTLHEVVSARNVNLIWAKVFKNRYCAEVQHTGTCRGNLIVFDGANLFRVLHEEPVEIQYDGRPVDPVDITSWETIVSGVVESLSYN